MAIQKAIANAGYRDPLKAMTVKALEERQKRAAEAAANSQTVDMNMMAAGPLGIFAHTLGTATAGLQEGRAANAAASGRQELAQLIGGIDPTKGPAPDQLQRIYERDPDFGQKLLEWDLERRNKAATAEKWIQIPTPKGESGQWFQNSVSGEQKKVGGATDGTGGPKLTDLGSLRDDYTKAASTYDNAAPSWQSMQEAAKTAMSTSDVEGKGVADYNMVVGFAKLLDPGSVVREGEVETVRATGGPADYLIGYLNTIKGEGSLSDGVRRGIMTEANSRMAAYYAQAREKRDWIKGIATRHGMNPDDVLPPLADFVPWGEEPAASDDTTPPADPEATPPAAKTLVKTVQNADGSFTHTYSDGTTKTVRMVEQ